jgi:aminobenzoyl-glutamate utilization protein B
MQLAARVLAASAWDLYHSPQTLDAARAELDRRRGERKYESLMQPGQKPALEYRNPARASNEKRNPNDERTPKSK